MSSIIVRLEVECSGCTRTGTITAKVSIDGLLKIDGDACPFGWSRIDDQFYCRQSNPGCMTQSEADDE